MKRIVYVLLSVVFLLSACDKEEPEMPEIPKIPMETMDGRFKEYLLKNFDHPSESELKLLNKNPGARS